MTIRHAILVLVCALLLTPGTILAAKKKPASTPAPAPVPWIALADSLAPKVFLTPLYAPGAVSLTPGPMLVRGSPIENRTTIVPFPPPGVTAATEIQLYRTMNVPRAGRFQLLATTPGSKTHPDSAGTPARITLH